MMQCQPQFGRTQIEYCLGHIDKTISVKINVEMAFLKR